MMTTKAQEAIGTANVTVLADRGYFKGEEILTTEQTDLVPEKRTP
jgi:hypothetical protein